MQHHSSVWRVQSKEYYFMFTYTFVHFLIKEIFISFFDEALSFLTEY